MHELLSEIRQSVAGLEGALDAVGIGVAVMNEQGRLLHIIGRRSVYSEPATGSWFGSTQCAAATP